MAVSNEIGAGTANGLLAFCDYLIDRGLAPASAVQPWKSAAKQVFTRVEGSDEFGSVDVRALDVDEYLERFRHRSHGAYKPHSLTAYDNRFRKAVEAYRGYLADPMSWRPKLRTSPRRVRERGNGRIGSQEPSLASGAAQPAAPVPATSPATPPPAVPSLTDYPFPLRSGQMAHLYLPSPLDKDDADRLTQFLRALVFERPAELSSGEGDGE